MSQTLERHTVRFIHWERESLLLSTTKAFDACIFLFFIRSFGLLSKCEYKFQQCYHQLEEKGRRSDNDDDENDVET